MADSGTVVTYRELDERSKRLARQFYSRGLRPDDHLAVLLENHWHRKPDEVGYIVEDCAATALVTSGALAQIAKEIDLKDEYAGRQD